MTMFLKISHECSKHHLRNCSNCPFSELFDGKKLCIFNHVESDFVAMAVKAKLESMGEKPEEHSVPPKNVEATTTLYAKVPVSAEEFEKQLKALLPYRCTLEPLPEKDGPIQMPESSKPDNVNHPKHYCKGGVESIDFVKAAVSNLSGFEAVCVANIIKYMWRYKEKNGLEDVMKAAKYLEWLQEEVKNNG